jgi:type IV pilus assembly protein PilC
MTIQINTKEDNRKSSEKDFLQYLNEIMNKDISLGGTKFKDKRKASFYSELGILLSSGIDIKTSLEIITEQQSAAKVQTLYKRISDKVIGGMSLSEAMTETGLFSNYELFSIKIGEESGRIAEVLSELTVYYDRKIKQKRQLTGALTYPVVVTLTAVVAVIFMLRFIVPMFVDVFKRFNNKMPPLTQAILDLSRFVTDNSWLILLLLLGIIVFFAFAKKQRWFRRIVSGLLLSLPGIKEVIKKVYIARFCQAMSLLISSRTPMLRSINLVRNMISFYPYEVALKQIEQDILHGKTLHECMADYSIFDKRIIALTKVAEEVNQLDRIFARLNSQYTEELEHQIGIISNLLEPFMIIIVGLMVGTILIAMYLPMFQLGSSFM